MEIKYLNDECERISKTSDLEFGKEATRSEGVYDLMGTDMLKERGLQQFALPDTGLIQRLHDIIAHQIRERLALYQEVPDMFDLTRYHEYLIQPDIHFKVSTWALDYKILGDAFFEVQQHLESILNIRLKVKSINHNDIEGEYIGFRVLRPGQKDHNPFHRDSWIDYWRDTINIWLPICGFENGNCIQFIPHSHSWPDDEILKTKTGVEIDGKKYHVPAAIGTVNNFDTETPILQKGEGVIFSPYTIHGNGANKFPDITRVSLEFRFCRA